MDRRKFLTVGLTILAAPAIVKAENIMRIVVPKERKIFTGTNATLVINDLTVYTPDGKMIEFEKWQSHLLKRVATSLGVPYDMLAADMKLNGQLSLHMPVFVKGIEQ